MRQAVAQRILQKERFKREQNQALSKNQTGEGFNIITLKYLTGDSIQKANQLQQKVRPRFHVKINCWTLKDAKELKRTEQRALNLFNKTRSTNFNIINGEPSEFVFGVYGLWLWVIVKLRLRKYKEIHLGTAMIFILFN